MSVRDDASERSSRRSSSFASAKSSLGDSSFASAKSSLEDSSFASAKSSLGDNKITKKHKCWFPGSLDTYYNKSSYQLAKAYYDKQEVYCETNDWKNEDMPKSEVEFNTKKQEYYLPTLLQKKTKKEAHSFITSKKLDNKYLAYWNHNNITHKDRNLAPQKSGDRRCFYPFLPETFLTQFAELDLDKIKSKLNTCKYDRLTLKKFKAMLNRKQVESIKINETIKKINEQLQKFEFSTSTDFIHVSEKNDSSLENYSLEILNVGEIKPHTFVFILQSKNQLQILGVEKHKLKELYNAINRPYYITDIATVHGKQVFFLNYDITLTYENGKIIYKYSYSDSDNIKRIEDFEVDLCSSITLTYHTGTINQVELTSNKVVKLRGNDYTFNSIETKFFISNKTGETLFKETVLFKDSRGNDQKMYKNDTRLLELHDVTSPPRHTLDTIPDPIPAASSSPYHVDTIPDPIPEASLKSPHSRNSQYEIRLSNPVDNQNKITIGTSLKKVSDKENGRDFVLQIEKNGYNNNEYKYKLFIKSTTSDIYNVVYGTNGNTDVFSMSKETMDTLLQGAQKYEKETLGGRKTRRRLQKQRRHSSKKR